jgi:hypothetical protein
MTTHYEKYEKGDSMAVDLGSEQIIEVHVLSSKQVIATISCPQGGVPTILKCDAEYEDALKALLEQPETASLATPEGRMGGPDKRPSTTYDGVRIHSQGEKDYAFALAHELTHHPIEGKILRGIVKSRKVPA